MNNNSILNRKILFENLISYIQELKKKDSQEQIIKNQCEKVNLLVETYAIKKILCLNSTMAHRESLIKFREFMLLENMDEKSLILINDNEAIGKMFDKYSIIICFRSNILIIPDDCELSEILLKVEKQFMGFDQPCYICLSAEKEANVGCGTCSNMICRICYNRVIRCPYCRTLFNKSTNASKSVDTHKKNSE